VAAEPQPLPAWAEPEPPKRQTTAVSAPAKTSVAAKPETVPTLPELPEAVRRDLPALTIGGSIYSKDAANRMLIINGQLFHEKDTVAPGLVVERIELKSAVLRFKEHRYSIAF